MSDPIHLITCNIYRSEQFPGYIVLSECKQSKITHKVNRKAYHIYLEPMIVLRIEQSSWNTLLTRYGLQPFGPISIMCISTSQSNLQYLANLDITSYSTAMRHALASFANQPFKPSIAQLDTPFKPQDAATPIIGNNLNEINQLKESLEQIRQQVNNLTAIINYKYDNGVQ